MKMRARLIAAVWALNTVGFALYLGWLATCRERIMESREGVLYLLPVVAFLFVFASLWGARARPPGAGVSSEN